MDAVRLASPWLLALALPVWAVILYALPRKKGPQAASRAILPCLAAGLLILAIAGPSVRISRPAMCPLIIVQDISASMSPRRPDAAPRPAEALAPFAAAVPARHAGLVQFAARADAVVEPFTPQADGLYDPATFPRRTPGDAETNIQAALEQAAAIIPAGPGAVLLYSDARETRGDALAAATALAARGIQVHAIAPAIAPRDVGIVAVSAPAEAAIGKPVSIEVRLAATVAAAATVRLVRSLPGNAASEERWERQAALDPVAGATLIFEDAPATAGLYEYRAQVISDADDWPENNRASALIRIGAAREVILLPGGAASPAILAMLRAKLHPDIRIRAIPVASWPSPDSGESAIILDNISAWALGRDRAEELARRVTDGGLGLLVLGGDSAFAAGGYADSPIETILPVTSRLRERRPLELVLVVDSSGSMNEAAGELRKLTLAKQAVLALRPALAEADRVAVVAFAGEPRIASPLVPVSAWETLRQRLLEIEAGGGTRITPAVEAAISLLGTPPADPRTIRHVLLLTDGRSEDFDVARLVADCRAARATISAVATGTDVDLPRLARLAQETGGRMYDQHDLARLAETFLHDMAWVRGEGLRQENRPAEWRRPEPVWRTTGPPLPPVSAYNATRAKPDADILWTTPASAGAEPAPLLAVWRRGLGKVAAIPWPVADAAGKWTEGNSLGGYLAAVLAWLDAPQVPTDWSARLSERGPARQPVRRSLGGAGSLGEGGGDWWIRVEQRPEAIGKPAAFAAAVFGPPGAESPAVAFAQVAPGIFEARIGPRGDQAAASVAVRAEKGALGRTTLAIPGLPPREFDRFGVDRHRLEAIVQAGGGGLHTRPETLAEALARIERPDFLPVGIYLVFAAGAAVVLQIALRLAGRL